MMRTPQQHFLSKNAHPNLVNKLFRFHLGLAWRTYWTDFGLVRKVSIILKLLLIITNLSSLFFSPSLFFCLYRQYDIILHINSQFLSVCKICEKQQFGYLPIYSNIKIKNIAPPYIGIYKYYFLYFINLNILISTKFQYLLKK